MRLTPPWIGKWKTAKEMGKEVTGKQLKSWVSEGIQGVPETMLTRKAKDTLAWAFNLELDRLGISDTAIVLPGVH